MFYDYGVGDASYLSLEGIIKGTITNKRQFKIEHKKLIHIFDNNLNIDDEVLQEVLSKEANDKMKNIVNTIQQEQNEVIRNIENKTLIVQGIAGSGKTSVALHRIAFLLYKIKNLTSNNILIFSPNKVFSEYISNVLPELGEDNTLQTTFDSFLESNILEFRHVESFSRFIERYYKETEKNIELVKYKQSDRIINDLDQYIKSLEEKAEFISDIKVDKMYCTKDELNILLKRYKHFLLFDRIPAIASKLCDYYENGKHTKLKRIIKELYNAFNIKRSFKEIYKDFYRSKYFPNIPITEREIIDMMNKKEIKYEDACVFCYLKGLLEGFEYRGLIKQVVIDEAQDYNQLQYQIIKKIFPKSGFTILGDVNQTINPYYQYKSLDILTEIFDDNVKYLELKKTYRSSEEIIEYTNKILGLEHIQAIRKKNQHPVLLKQEEDITKQLIKDINLLKQESKSIAIITKTDTEANDIFKKLENEVKGISLLTGNDSKFNRDLIVIPSYIAKGLEFDSVIIYTAQENKYKEYEKNLYYVACTRAQHQLIIYNQ
ncbi:MAG: helicase [Firmicutes bacterium]|nr:helicase [Bacillota bacterium]